MSNGKKKGFIKGMGGFGCKVFEGWGLILKVEDCVWYFVGKWKVVVEWYVVFGGKGKLG